MEGRILHSFGMSETSKPPVLIKKGGVSSRFAIYFRLRGVTGLRKKPKTLEKRRVGSEPREVEGRMLHSFGEGSSSSFRLSSEHLFGSFGDIVLERS